jgi:hypothetical protein
MIAAAEEIGTHADRERAGDVIQREVDEQIAQKAKARGLRALPKPMPVVIERGGDGYDALIQPGIYSVRFVEEKKVERNKRFTYYLTFEVLDGEAAGIELRMFLNALPAGRRPGPGWFMGSAYNIATGLRPPSDLYRMKPSEFLSDCIFDAIVVDVKRDANGIERVGTGRYSRIKALKRKTAGSPPCIRKRRGPDAS